MKGIWKAVRRIAIIIAGSVVLLAGIAMLVLPGPAVIVIPLGVSILAIEIPAARRVMKKARVWIGRKRKKYGPKLKLMWKRIKNGFRRHPPSARNRDPFSPVTGMPRSRTHR